MQEFRVKNHTFHGYLAIPESHTGIGVLVCHAWWGLTAFFTHICDNLAKEGFVAIAPDLFHGATAQTIDEAKHLRSQVDRKEAKKEVSAAIDYLSAHSAVSAPHLGTIGFSYGCGYAIEVARQRSGVVKAVSLFYGTGGGKFDTSQAAFQGHFAAHDEWGANPKKAHMLKQRILEAHQIATFYIYPKTTHWFFESDNAAYNAEAAQLAWQRTIHFLREQLS